jgi:hypothetical protein
MNRLINASNALPTLDPQRPVAPIGTPTPSMAPPGPMPF